MPYFIYVDLISSLLDSKIVDPGSTLIHVGAMVHVFFLSSFESFFKADDFLPLLLRQRDFA